MRISGNKTTGNIFSSLPNELGREFFEDLLCGDRLRIERIVSKGHTSPETGWYDQDENEWVMVLEGAGTILFENGKEVHLTKGDYVNIPSNARHRVIWTDPDRQTVWLAVYYW